MRGAPLGLWVALGGAVGAVARFLAGDWTAVWATGGFPWNTFVINVAGSALLGFLYRALPAPSASPQLRAFFAVGICGGFTTFSAFDYETFSLLQHNAYVTAGLYSLGSVLTCMAGVYGGFTVAALMRRHPGAAH